MNILSRQQAISAGLPKYFTGEFCSHGHVSERYVSTMQCCQCVSAYARNWKESNPEKSAKVNSEWRGRNKETVKQWKSDSQKRNRVSANVRNKKWADANREQLRAYSSAWQKANPAKVVAKSMRRHAAKLQRMPAWADHKAIEQTAQIARVTWPDVEIHVDHVVPLRGPTVSGLHVHRNLQITTGPANRAKATHF